MSDNTSNKPTSTDGGTANQPPISWELISKLTPDEHKALPRERQLELSQWMNNPKNKRSK